MCVDEVEESVENDVTTARNLGGAPTKGVAGLETLSRLSSCCACYEAVPMQADHGCREDCYYKGSKGNHRCNSAQVCGATKKRHHTETKIALLYDVIRTDEARTKRSSTRRLDERSTKRSSKTNDHVSSPFLTMVHSRCVGSYVAGGSSGRWIKRREQVQSLWQSA